MNLEAKQREMRQRMAKRHKRDRTRTRIRTPMLGRGIYVAPIRKAKPTADFGELQQLITAHLRSPRITAGEFHKLFEIGVRYGLVLPDIRPISAPQSEETESGIDVRVGESQVSLKEILRLEREKRARVIKERETNKQ